MYVLTAAVILVGLLCLLSLLLTVGVIKRLRDHTAILAAMRAMAGIEVGDEVGEFQVVSVDGEPLSRESLGEDSLVAFFAPHCKPCAVAVPEFIRHAEASPGHRGERLAVVVGEPEESAAMAAELRQVARVVVEQPLGALSTAFRTSATPTVLRVGTDRSGRQVVKADRVTLTAPVSSVT
jgi:thiol-disulfide isomerase/thioredoxin